MKFLRLPASALAVMLVLAPLGAQDDRSDAAIQAAQTARKPELLEDAAAKLEERYQYDQAEKLLAGAVALRAQVNGDQSADYALSLLKLGALERKTGHAKEAASHYATAVRLLPGRPETAPVFLYLGITAIGRKDFLKATENLQRAQSLDLALAGQALMWTALMLERQDQRDEAEAAYKTAITAGSPDSMETFEALTLYGRFLKERGRDEEAKAILARTALRSPKDASKVKSIAGSYRVGAGVHPPTVLSKVDPPYSEEARVAKYSGTVLLHAVVDVDGTAKEIQVIKSAGFGLDECATVSLAKWRFKPGEMDTTPVPVQANVEVNFRLL